MNVNNLTEHQKRELLEAQRFVESLINSARLKESTCCVFNQVQGWEQLHEDTRKKIGNGVAIYLETWVLPILEQFTQ